MITSKESLDHQKEVSQNMQQGEYSEVYNATEQIVDADYITNVLEKIRDERFDDAVQKSLATTTEGDPIYQGEATAVLVDIDGNVRAYYSNSQNNPEHITFAKAALQKATARAFLERDNKSGGLFHNKGDLQKQGYKRHDGAAIPSVTIDGIEYFIGVSGAMVDEEYTRKLLKNEESFNASSLPSEYSMWRGAGFWDFLCATLVKNNLNGRSNTDIGPIVFPDGLINQDFFD